MRHVLSRILAGTLLTAVFSCVADQFDLAARSALSPQDAASYEGVVIFLDVRSDAEWAAGHIRGALHIPHGEVMNRIGEVIPGTSVPIITYCVSGGRAAMVVEGLREIGYQVVPVMGGGYRQLIDSGLASDFPGK